LQFLLHRSLRFHEYATSYLSSLLRQLRRMVNARAVNQTLAACGLPLCGGTIIDMARRLSPESR